MKKPPIFHSPLIFMLIALASPQANAETEAPMQPSTPSDFKKGRLVYKSSCSQCHDTGGNGAPKLGDAAAWKDRLFEWYPVMNKHAASGYLKMPAKGNHTLLSDEEVSNAVFYMTEKLKGRQ